MRILQDPASSVFLRSVFFVCWLAILESPHVLVNSKGVWGSCSDSGSGRGE